MNRMLFAYANLRHGGIETLIIRLANYLAKHGRRVAICHSGGAIADNIAACVEQLIWFNRKDAVNKAVSWIEAASDPVTMVSFDPISAALGLGIEASIAKPVRVVHLSGVYHPRSFFMTGERRDRIFLNRLVAKAVGDPFIFYMNEECRADHERKWRKDLQRSRIIPIPIEERPDSWHGSGTGELRIVSVGRLVDFKTYNLAAAELAAECRENGITLHWYIYGLGPLESEMLESIDKHGIGGAVELKGELPYEAFEKTVANYDLFIGMGTAALEAAMIGVPTIVPTESERRCSYGFVSDLPFGNVGERQSFSPPYDLAAQILNYAALDVGARQEIGRKGRNAVLDYTYDHCIEELDRLARDVDQPPAVAFKKAVATLYSVLTDSRLADVARQLLSLTRSEAPSALNGRRSGSRQG